MTHAPALFAVGGAHIDRRARISGDYVPGASNPGTMREEVGGGAFNACRMLARRGAKVAFMSVRGGDAAGNMVASAIRKAKIEDLSSVHLDRTTPNYMALIDRHGGLIAGMADMALYEAAFARQLARRKLREAAARADAVLCDANLPEAAIERLLRITTGKPVYAIAISPAKVSRMRPYLPRLGVLFMNLREARALAEAPPDADAPACAELLARRGLRSGVITQGGNPVATFDHEGTRLLQPPAPPAIIDETGAGDALAGATMAAMIKGQPIHRAIREGLAAAWLAVGTASTVPDFTSVQFAAAIEQMPEVQPQEEGVAL